MTDDERLVPFRIAIDDAEIDDLRERVRRTRWPLPAPGGNQAWERGVPPNELRDLADYWATTFDWRDQEATLNRMPQATTVIDGQTIHFVHVRADGNALPLLLLHSWPGSPVEFVRLIDPLVNPSAFAGDPDDAFHVVVPSIPGFGFSVPVGEAGWASSRIARAMAELMARLGYERYAVAGGDIGAGIAAALTSVDPDHVVAAHLTTDPPTAVTFAGFSGDPAAHPRLSPSDRERVEELKRWSADDEGYLRIQSTRPQTIGYSLTDSPVGLLAWIVEKVHAWSDASIERPEDAIDRDLLLTNVSLYWFTRSAASAAHALYESMHAQEWNAPGPAPIGFAVFGAEPFVRTLLDAEHQVAHWSTFTRGGHFPAMEQPSLLADDLRAFLGAYRRRRSADRLAAVTRTNPGTAS